MDKKQAIDIARIYKRKVSKLLPLKALYLFGSYSKGEYSEESDIDIAVILEKRADNYFEEIPILWRIGRQVSYLIEPVVLTEGENTPLFQDVIKTGILTHVSQAQHAWFINVYEFMSL